MPYYDDDDVGWDSPEMWQRWEGDSEEDIAREDVTDEFDEWLDEEEDAA